MICRFLVLLTTVLLSHNTMGSTMEMQLLSTGKLQQEFSYLQDLATAIGQVEFRQGRSSDRFYQSGFFINETLVMTSYPASLEEDAISCPNITFAVADVLRNYNKKTYRCQEILEHNPEYGFMIFQTTETHSQYHLDRISSEFSFMREGAFFTLGRSYQDFLFLSTNCWADFYSCPDCEEFEIAPNAWMGARCLHLTQMSGSPVFSRATNDFRVVGMLSSLDLPLDPMSATMNSETHLVSASQIKKVSRVLKALDAPPPTCSIEFEPPRIKQGESAKLIIRGHGPFLKIEYQGKKYEKSPVTIKVNPLQDTRYTADISSFSGRHACSATLRVEKVPAPTCTIDIQPRKIVQGDTAKVTVNVVGQFNELEINGLKSKTAPFTFEVTPWNDTTYNVVVSGHGGKNSCSADIEVKRDPDFGKNMLNYQERKCNKKGDCIWVKHSTGSTQGEVHFEPASGSSCQVFYNLDDTRHVFIDMNENQEWVFIGSASIAAGRACEREKQHSLSGTLTAGAAAINENGYWVAVGEKYVWGGKYGSLSKRTLHTFSITNFIKAAGVRMDSNNKWFVRVKDENGNVIDQGGQF